MIVVFNKATGDFVLEEDMETPYGEELMSQWAQSGEMLVTELDDDKTYEDIEELQSTIASGKL